MTSAQASVVFSQPPNTEAGPFSQPNQRLADDFSIASGALINGVTWWGENYGGGAFLPFTISFYAYTNAGPGALLATNVVTPTFINTNVKNFREDDILEFSASIADFSAAAGTSYYFSVIENQLVHFTWAQSNAAPGQWSEHDGSTWDSVFDYYGSGSAAYSLLSSNTVPEPSTVLLIGAALAVLGVSRRKRRG